MRRYILAGRLGGVPVHIHWSLLAICALILISSFGSLAQAAGAVIAMLAYFASMIVHEWGHVVVARRQRCAVYGIELYPLVGLTRFQLPPTRLAHCRIAWGGVLFQAAGGVPMLAWIKLVGYTPIEPLNAFMAVFGFLSVVMIVMNLVPLPPLDGATAWSIVPLLLRRRASRSGGRGWNARR